MGTVDVTPVINLGLAIVLLWVPACFWMYSLIAAMIEAEMGMIEGLFGIGATFGIALICTGSTSRLAVVLGGIALWTSACVAPYARRFFHRKAHLSIDIEKLEKLSNNAVTNPNNTAVYSELGRMCAKLRLVPSACVFLERAVTLSPDFTKDEKRMLTYLQREVDGVPNDHPNHCPNCRAPNPPGEIRCRKCHGPILVLLGKGTWLPQSAGGRLLRVWIVVMAVGILSPIIGLTVQSAFAIPLIVSLAFVGLFLLWQIWRR